MANKILAVLNRPELAESLRRDAASELRVLSWEAAARKCVRVYNDLIEPLSSALAAEAGATLAIADAWPVLLVVEFQGPLAP